MIALLSAIPTIEFLSWRKMLKAGQAPQPDPSKLKFVAKIIHGELMGIVIILFAAAMMARGGWR